MSKEIQDQNNKNDEVDLLVLFNYIGDKFSNLFRFIKSLFTGVYSIFIIVAKIVFNYIKIIISVVLIALILGYTAERFKPKTYDSSMLVRTYFDAKYQLATNINYYNALLGDKDYESLSEIFDIEEEEISKIISFEMSVGPETENERIVEYDRFLKSIDSTRAAEITFEDFVENRDIYTGNLFEIRVESNKKDIFKSLETGINKSFENRFSTKKMAKRDSMISIKRENILNSIEQIDSLKKVYINVIENESRSPRGNVGTGEGFPILQEKSQTKEYQLLDKEIKLRDELRSLDEQKLEENVFFDVISSFQIVGNAVKTWRDRYTIIFPFLAFAFLCIYYITNKFALYVKNYEV